MSIVGVIYVGVGLLAVRSLRAPASPPLGQSFDLERKYFAEEVKNVPLGVPRGDPAATTTLTYFLSTSATSTSDFFIAGAESVDLNFHVAASTTATAPYFALAFSDNKKDWFREGNKTAATNISTIHGATTTHALPTGSGQWSVTITPLASRYMRLYVWFAEANGGIWVEAVLKKGL